MKEINDKELDQLIAQSLQRQQIFAKVSTEALAAAKRFNQQRKIKRVLRLVGFAFGVPTFLAVMGYGAYSISTLTDGVMGYVAAAVTVMSAIAVATYSVVNFSLEEV